MPGPLAGLRVIEMAAIGPVPFTGMLLADLGAEVLRIDRPEPVDLGFPVRLAPRFDVFARGKQALALDLKSDSGRATILSLARRADALIEGFRPGVMERLELGPDALLAVNPRLVYGRMTGFGQQGPLASQAGHDINYIALSGVLHAIGEKDGPPVPPLSLVGDFGGGAMFLAVGLLAALLEAKASGRGQVIDASMVGGSAYLMAAFFARVSAGAWQDERGVNVLDGGAPWYGTYRTKDGRYVAVGAIERRFYAELLDKLGLAQEALPDQHDRSGWPKLRERLAEVFATRTRKEWEDVFAGSDACVTPVLSMTEAPRHTHAVACGTFLEREGVPQPAPQPVFSRTPSGVRDSSEGDAVRLLEGWGLESDEIAALTESGRLPASRA